MKRFIAAVTFLLLVAFNAAVAQKPMTNADVIALVKANLPEDTIVKVIQQSPCNFDLSTQSLTNLTNQQVPEKVIKAMQAKVALPSQAGTAVMPGMPGWVQYKGAKGLVPLDTALLTGGASGSGAGVIINPFARVKEFYVYHGAHARVQISESTPTFILSNAARVRPDTIYLARLEQKEDTRRLQMGNVGLGGSDSGIPKKSRVEVNITQLPDDSLSVTPAHALADGEYLIYQLQGQGYEFGISSGR